MLKKILSSTALVAALALSPFVAGDVLAQKNAGDLMVRLRGIGVVPDEKASLKLNGGSIAGDVSLSTAIVPEADFTYFITKNIALELIAATTRHSGTVKGGPLNGTDIGHVWLLPPTLSAQFHPLPDSMFSPYVGAGINYTIFYNEKIPNVAGLPTTVSYKDNFGWALQAGLDVQIDKKWYANIDVKKLWLKTDATIRIPSAGLTVKGDVEINPWIIGVGIGYKF